MTDTLMLFWSLPSYVTTPPSPTSPTYRPTIYPRVLPSWFIRTLAVSKCCGEFVDLALLQHYYAKLPGRYVGDLGDVWELEGYNQFRVEGGAVLDLGWQMLCRANDRERSGTHMINAIVSGHRF